MSEVIHPCFGTTMFLSFVITFASFGPVSAQSNTVALPDESQRAMKLGQTGAQIESDLEALAEQLTQAENSLNDAVRAGKNGQYGRTYWGPQVTNLRRSRLALQQWLFAIDRAEDPFPLGPSVAISSVGEMLQWEMKLDKDRWLLPYQKTIFQIVFSIPDQTPADKAGPASRIAKSKQSGRFVYDEAFFKQFDTGGIALGSFQCPPGAWVDGIYESPVLDALSAGRGRVGKDVIVLTVRPVFKTLYFQRIELPGNRSIDTLPPGVGGKLTVEYKSALLSNGETSSAGGGNTAELVCWEVEAVHWKAPNDLENHESPTTKIASEEAAYPTTVPTTQSTIVDPETLFWIARGFEEGGQIKSAIRRYKVLSQKYPGTRVSEWAETRRRQLEGQRDTNSQSPGRPGGPRP